MTKPETKFKALLEYMTTNSQIPQIKYIYNYDGVDIAIGYFFRRIFNIGSFKRYNKDSWIEQLRSISLDTKEQIDRYMNNKYNKRRKPKDLTEPHIKLEAILKYIEENKKTPIRKTIYRYKGFDISIGIFYDTLKIKKSHFKFRKDWLEQINKAKEKYIDPEILRNKTISSELKFHALYRYIEENHKLPVQKCIYQYGDLSIKIGSFLGKLLIKPNMLKKQRELYLNQLKEISPDIAIAIEKRQQ